ncbi:MAG TPA: hypothetical protein VGN64_16995 [Dyadobacter sp.]|jgi:hypothetical protein|nr:hypothetical protein [Dyadobacter sp.]
MDYFSKQQVAGRYFYAVKNYTWPECADGLTVIQYPTYMEYGIRISTFIPIGSEKITKEEFEAAYDNAINSFMPYLESSSISSI